MANKSISLFGSPSTNEGLKNKENVTHLNELTFSDLF
jgi:hypothetical protein